MWKIKRQDGKYFQLCAQRIEAILNATTSTRADLHDLWDVFTEEVLTRKETGCFQPIVQPRSEAEGTGRGNVLPCQSGSERYDGAEPWGVSRAMATCGPHVIPLRNRKSL